MAQAAQGGAMHATVPEGAGEGETTTATAASGAAVPVRVRSALAVPAPIEMTPGPARGPIRLTKKVRVNTRPVDGMRGFAVMHIVIGHFFHWVGFVGNTANVGPEAAPGSTPAWAEDQACPAGWGLHKGTCYFGACDWLTWEGANDACGKLANGALLSNFEKDQDMGIDHWVHDKFFLSSTFWVGLNEREEKGAWVWANGTAPNGTLWHEGEPNDFRGTNEECGFVHSGTRTYYDAPCSLPLPYMCSVPAREGQCSGNCTDADFWTSGSNSSDRCSYDLLGPVSTSSSGSSGEGAGCMIGFVALMGGGSMGFFYIISGFVMMVGYAQLPLRPARDCRESVCGPSADRVCCICLGAGEREEDIGSLPALDARGFLRKRFARLAPMYYLMMIWGIIFTIVAGPLVPGAGIDSGFLMIISALGLTSWFLQFPIGAGWLWTVSTMMFFYLCFPALAPRVQRIRPENLRAFALVMFALQAAVLVCMAILVSIATGFQAMDATWLGYWARMWPPARLPIFVMGLCCGMERVHAEHARGLCGAGEGQEEGSPRPQPVRQVCPVITPLAGCFCLQPVAGLGVIWLSLTLLCSLVSFLCSGLIMPLRGGLEMFFPILFYDWIYAATDPEQRNASVARFFASRAMVFLGGNSMCIYMVHYHLVWIMAHLLGVPWGLMPVWTVFVLVPASVLLGFVFTRFFERPMAHLLRPREARRGKAGRAAGGGSTAEKTGTNTTASSELASTWAPNPVLVGAPTTVTESSKLASTWAPNPVLVAAPSLAPEAGAPATVTKQAPQRAGSVRAHGGESLWLRCLPIPCMQLRE